MPSGSALVTKTSNVWSNISSLTKNLLQLLFTLSLDLFENSIVIASAADVPSSSKDALDNSIPVKSHITVW